MKMNELIRYEIPPEILALWRERESERLLPLQELAVKRHDLFGGGNLLIQAPTSSGKTFIGEMAVLHTALRRKKVVYLVPLKALAEEKYLDFEKKYASYGLKVIISTRDHREFDRDFEEGDFSIAVVVYEKLAQLLVRRPERIAEIELAIADELELLSDPERGSVVEILLTRILRSKCRLIGLSAVIGEAEKLAAWMQAELVYYERRPVELRYGVIFDGTFKYRTYNEFGEGEEAMCEWAGDSAWEILSHNVAMLSERGETCLIFVKAKHESRRAAEILAERLNLPAANEALEALGDVEATRSRDSLMRTLTHGVAFHNADLSPEERVIAERAFRAGEARVMVSTGTLAVGMNLPAKNVFLSADRWRYDDRAGMPWKTPILRSEYENMSGRAGRYGAGHEFGRAMLIAATPFDQETLWRRYVDGEREGIEPQLGREALENHVLRLVSSRCCRDLATLQDFLEATLTGQWQWLSTYTRDEVAFRIRAAVNRCIDTGVLASDGENGLEATPFGHAVASKGIRIDTARDLEHWIAESEQREWSPIDLLFAAASTLDGRALNVMLSTKEYERADYPAQLKVRTRHEELAADVPLNRIRNCALQPFFEDVRAIKTALFLEEWINHASVRHLEEHYNTMAGQILSAAEQISWVVDAAAAIATALGAASDFVDRIRELAERTTRGLQAEMLPLGRLRAPALGRTALLGLHEHACYTAEAIVQAPVGVLRQWMPNGAARSLKKWAQAQRLADAETDASARVQTVSAENTLPVLVVDDRRPGEIHVNGKAVALQDKQYRLIRLLATCPGECVSYDSLYEVLWGDVMVENNQIHFQKRRLLKCIEVAVPDAKTLIKTIPKRGFLLDLAPAEVVLHQDTACHAA
jgi:helicase